MFFFHYIACLVAGTVLAVLFCVVSFIRFMENHKYVNFMFIFFCIHNCFFLVLKWSPLDVVNMKNKSGRHCADGGMKPGAKIIILVKYICFIAKL